MEANRVHRLWLGQSSDVWRERRPHALFERSVPNPNVTPSLTNPADPALVVRDVFYRLFANGVAALDGRHFQ
jgi:hypothetical protein